MLDRFQPLCRLRRGARDGRRSATKFLRNPQSKCHKGMKAIWSIALIGMASIGASSGVNLSFEVNTLKECGEHIRVETQPSRSDKGLISVSVTFAPTAPEPYRGRVKAFGKLVVKNGDEPIAVSNLESTHNAGVFTFGFQLAREAFRSSELILSSVLYEPDGLATVGGGERYRLHLKGFQPDEQTKAEAAPPNAGPAMPLGNSDSLGGGHHR